MDNAEDVKDVDYGRAGEHSFVPSTVLGTVDDESFDLDAMRRDLRAARLESADGSRTTGADHAVVALPVRKKLRAA